MLTECQELWSWVVLLAQHLLLRTDNSSKTKWNEQATHMQTLLWKRQKQLGRALFLQHCADAGCWARYDKAEIKRQQGVLSGDHCSATASLVTCLELHPLKNCPCAFSAGHCQEMSRSSFTASSWEAFQCWARTDRLPSGFLSPPSTSSSGATPRLNWGTVRLQGKQLFSVTQACSPDSHGNLTPNCPSFTGTGVVGFSFMVLIRRVTTKPW